MTTTTTAPLADRGDAVLDKPASMAVLLGYLLGAGRTDPALAAHLDRALARVAA